MVKDKVLAKLQKVIRKSKVSRRSRTNNLLILTWNIKKFSGEKSDKAVKYIAAIIKKFDVIAIQEVMNDLRGIEKLQKALGSSFRFIFSDASGNGERLVFCYYKNNVKFTGLAAEIVNNPGHGREKNRNSNLEEFEKKPSEEFAIKMSALNRKDVFQKMFEIFAKNRRIGKIYAKSTKKEPLKKGDVVSDAKGKIKLEITDIERKNFGKKNPKNGYYVTFKLMHGEAVKIIAKDFVLEFDRTPYVASFQKNDCHFIVTNIHIFYGASNQIEYRREEIELLAKYIDTKTASADVLDPDYIACGDFNIEEAVKHELKRDGKRTDAAIRKSLFDALTRHNFRIPQIIRDTPTNLAKDMHYDQIGYQYYEEDKEKNITASTIEFSTGSAIDFVDTLNPEFEDLANDFTDHLPLWAEFKIRPDKTPIQINV